MFEFVFEWFVYNVVNDGVYIVVSVVYEDCEYVKVFGSDFRGVNG